MDHTGKRSHKKSRMVESQAPEMKDVNKKAEVHTPDTSQISTGGKTSTPTSDGYMFQDIDASAIHPDVSILSTGQDLKSIYSKLGCHTFYPVNFVMGV